MSRLDYILDFVLDFSEKMLVCGGTLERTNDTLVRICASYGCKDIQFFSLSCYISLSMKDEEGSRVSGQRRITGTLSTNLTDLSRLNDLSREVCKNHPEPEKLNGMLNEALSGEAYPAYVIWIGEMLAMACLGLINGGTWRDILVILLNSTLLYLGNVYLKRPDVNRIVYNLGSTFVVGTIAVLLTRVGFVENFYVIAIVNSLMLIPGIVYVNAFRNILCGNEINGILEIFRALLETLAIVGGFILAIALFGGAYL